MTNSWRVLQSTISQVLYLKLLWSHLRKMPMMHSSLNYSTHIYLWKNKEIFTWSLFQHLLDRFSAPLREARVVLIEYGLNIVFHCHRETDTCLLVKREAWTQPVITWLPSINRILKRKDQAILVKWDQTSWEPSSQSSTLRKTQRRLANRTKIERAMELCNTRPTCLDQRDPEGWRFFFQW